MMHKALLAAAMLLLSSVAQAQAVLMGVVLSDSTRQPIANAVVSLPTQSKAVLTNEKGESRIDDIAPGQQLVRVRRLGYVEFTARLDFTANDTLQQTVYLKHFVTLDSVVVNAPNSADEHNRSGFGHMVTREDLAKHDNEQLADVLSRVPCGVVVIHTRRSPDSSNRARRSGPLVSP